MKYTYLLIFLLIISTSCKQNNNNERSNNIEKKDISIPYDTSHHYQSSIYYAPNKSTDAKWFKYIGDTEMNVTNMSWTNNSIFLTVEMKEKHSLSRLQIWAVDSLGETVMSKEINDLEKMRYSSYNSFILTQTKTYPSFFYLQENPIHSAYASDINKDIEALIKSLDKYSIVRLIWNNSLKDYQKKESTLDGIFSDFVKENNICHIGSVSFRRIGGYILIYGEVNTLDNDYAAYPFLVLLSENSKLLKSKIYTDTKYAYTYIDNLEIANNNHIIVKATKRDAADGYYYDTQMMFEVNENLQLIKDYSDDKPYYSYYRGPSVPDYSEDEEDRNTEEDVSNSNREEESSEEKEEVTEVKNKETTEKILDTNKDFYFTINFNEDKEGTYNLKKINAPNDSLLYERNFRLSHNYSYKTAIITLDGGFVLAFTERTRTSTPNDYDKNGYISRLVCFKFNKEGNLTEQYETTDYYGSIGYVNFLDIGNSNIVTAFLIINSYFDGENWHYPQKLGLASFPYRSSFSSKIK